MATDHQAARRYMVNGSRIARAGTRLRLARVQWIEAVQPLILAVYAYAFAADHLPTSVRVLRIPDEWWSLVVAALAVVTAAGLIGVVTGWYYSARAREIVTWALASWWSGLVMELYIDGRWLHATVAGTCFVGGLLWSYFTRLESERGDCRR